MPPRTRFDRDYYRLLEIGPEATEDEVRRAYRRQALRWHPDRNAGRPEAEERFKEISEAYAVLIDARKRRQYDQARQAGRPGDFRATRDDLFRDLFSDPHASAVFEELIQEFERMGVRVHRERFEDVLFRGRRVVITGVVSIDPFGAAARAARQVLFGGRAGPTPRPTTPAARPGILSAIGQLGRRLLGLGAHAGAADGRDAAMPLRVTRAEAERGARKRVTVTADGRTEEVLVKVPAGIGAGARLRLRGKGRSAPGSSRGDLYLTVEIVEGW
jgi:DnaJ-class molecular chaperone